jgi:hypothetical protein
MLQYIHDSNGNTSGVFIPIEEWNKLKSQLPVSDSMEFESPDWHQQIVAERFEEYGKNPTKGESWDELQKRLKK